MSDHNFRFDEERNVAVFTVKQIFEKNIPILYVSHDEEDGAWQFLTGDVPEVDDMMIVALEQIVMHDPTINELFDLPMGNFAERKFVGDKWIRRSK